MYKSVVSLAPYIPNGFGDGTMNQIMEYCNQRFRTLCWSLDDALNLVNGENASPESLIEVWNPETRDDQDIERIKKEAPNLVWMNYPRKGTVDQTVWALEPYKMDLRETLPQNGKWETRALKDVWALAIHHTGSWNSYYSNEENAINIANYHVSSRNWVSAGYHYLIAPDGEIMQLNHLEEKTYHAGSYSAPGDENLFSIGIALGGDFRNHPPSEPQIFSAASIVSWLRRYLPKNLAVLGHKQIAGASTVCPGENIDSWMKRIAGNGKLIQ